MHLSCGVVPLFQDGSVKPQPSNASTLGRLGEKMNDEIRDAYKKFIESDSHKEKELLDKTFKIEKEEWPAFVSGWLSAQQWTKQTGDDLE